MPRADRLVWIALVVGLAFAGGSIAHRVVCSPAGRVILPDADAPWIMAAEPFSSMNRQWGRREAPVVVFSHRFTLERVPPDAVLEARAFGAFEVRVNDVAIDFDTREGRRWQARQAASVQHALRDGENRIDVTVRNRRGPALLSSSLSFGPDGSARIATGPGFTARIGSRPPEPARLADDVRRHPASTWLPKPADAVVHHAAVLAGALLLGGAVGLASMRRATRWPDARWTALATFTTGLLWVGLLITRYPGLPPTLGFDARAHLEYVALIADGRLPLATDGWSTYHPPLYHAAVALSGVAGDAFGATMGAVMRRLPGWLAGLGLVFSSAWLARRLYPDRVGLRALAVGFAAWLPVNLYVAASITNEGWSALFAANAVVCGSALWLAERVRTRELLWISGWLGLALLTKYTAGIAVAVVGGFSLWRIATERGSDVARRIRHMIALLGPALVLAGWYYARNLLVYGRPLVPNWDLPGPARVWWTAPGFHTPDYYTHFGRSLSEPFYAAFVSFGDGLYSTFWGDGLLSGAPGLQHLQAPWDLAWMAIVYWVALPMTAIGLVGAGAWFRDLLREVEPGRRVALGLPLVYLAAMGFAIVYATISLPFAGQGRASYGLSAVPVLAVCFARGVVALGGVVAGRGRGVLWATLGAVFSVYVLAVSLAFGTSGAPVGPEALFPG